MIGGAKGIGIGIDFGIPNQYCRATSKPYIEKDVLDSLRVVASAYGKSNDDADRSIVKNLVDASNPFIISNAAYEGMSGYNGYPVVFGKYKTWEAQGTKDGDKYYIYTSSANKFDITQIKISSALFYTYIKKNGELTSGNKDISSFKLKVTGLDYDKFYLSYYYLKSADVEVKNVINITSDGIYELPKSFASDGSLTETNSYIGLNFIRKSSEIPDVVGNVNVTIEILPNYEGALCFDGVDDMITSTKTVQDMLGGSNEITVVSMIHQIADRGSTYPNIYNNQIRYSTRLLRSTVTAANVVGKTGIYGYTATGVSITGTPTGKVVNDILGDKNDYPYLASAFTGIDAESHFSVEGYLSDSGNIIETSKVAWYWTIIANKVLTTDQINQVIAYFNLDRTLKPDIRCNIERQGITNDNHADFNDRLIDYSGNGRDIQMYNLAWKGGSGIAAKQYETFKDWTSESSSTSIIKQIDEFTRIVESTTNGYWVSRIRRDSDLDKVYSPINVYLYQDNNFLVHECKYEVDGVKYAIPINEPVGKGYHKLEMYTKDRYTELPENAENVVLSEWYFPKSTKGSIKYSIIPSCKGGILLDGINDFGKVIDMPIYKDYTFIIDREIISIGNTAGIVASKSEDSTDVNKQGAFLFEYLGAPNNISVWSFYKDNGMVANTDFTRGISYQSKYSYNGIELLAGTALDSDKLWLGILRDKDSRFANVAIYSLMSFPYTMSKFLIERQLKKHKLGTLYPDMVEFRPIVKSNLPYSSISYSVNPGEYISVDSMVTITVTLPNTSDKLMEVSCNAISDISISGDNGVYEITGKVGKSPQKINMIISSYLTILSNSTLISNETLIKNE